jgi:hypothetical protein
MRGSRFYLLAFAAAQIACGDVMISEFMAENDSTITNSLGKNADWVELHNTGSAAVDLSGWGLSDNINTPFKWTFPAGTGIGGGAYLLVWADSLGVSVTNGELHASFSLSKDGEYLGLTEPDGTVVSAFAPSFPAQMKDVSYGLGRALETKVGPGTAGKCVTLTSSGANATWAVTGGCGVQPTNGMFVCKQYNINTSISSTTDAETYIANSSYWLTDQTYPVTKNYATVNFQDTDCEDDFVDSNAAFPGNTSIGQGRDHFIVVSTGVIYVPTPSTWTFCVKSDDGFTLSISGNGQTFSSQYTSGRSFSPTLLTCAFAKAGYYNVRLLYYENAGGAALEFSCAPGSQSSFISGTFQLVGSSESGLVHTPDALLLEYVQTDLRSRLVGVSAWMDASWDFTLDNAPTNGDECALSIRAADGYLVKVNGTTLCQTNLPAFMLSSYSFATRDVTPEEAVNPVSYSVPLSLLKQGTNVLDIQVWNGTKTNTTFFVYPELTYQVGEYKPYFFREPTPAAANVDTTYSAPTPAVVFSEPHGYKTKPFSLTITCPSSPDSDIYYTTDGSTPSVANGTRYTEPLTISATTVLRACVPDSTSVFQNVTTGSWLFLADILQQSSTPPAGWPTSSINGQTFLYGMNTAIVTGDTERLCLGITNAEHVATLSIVTDLGNLFNSSTGIYVNADQSGIAWERAVSVEQIDPVHGPTNEFAVVAGLRIRGAYSRSDSNPKHALRLFFRSQYGASKLNFPLFGTEGADKFDKVDLRCSQNYSWAYENNSSETFIRETWSRDSQRDMGTPYTRSRYYHLYINGLYWGIYQTEERGDAYYAQTYMGGNEDDWDVIKTAKDGSYITVAADGNFGMFDALLNITASQGYTGAYFDNYRRVLGQNPDGTPNAAYPQYVNQDDLIDYMMISLYACDSDAPVATGGMPNNMYGLINRVEPAGFVWLRHDAEHSLGARSGYGVNDSTIAMGTNENFGTEAKFNPAYLNAKLCRNADYRMHFADLVQKHCYGDGALTAAKAQARFRSRMDELNYAIIGESARWGHGSKTRDKDWISACDYVLNTYMAQRRDVLVNQFKACGWFPNTVAPDASTNNATVASGTKLTLSDAASFYYTTDGSDPRLSGGAVNPAATAVSLGGSSNHTTGTLFQTNSVWSYYDAGSEPAASGTTTWKDAGYDDSAWASGPGTLGFIGGNGPASIGTTTKRYVNGVSGTQVTTTYFRRTVTMASDADKVVSLSATVLYDDGYVLYANGVEIARVNMPTGTLTYNTLSSSTIGSPAQTTFSTATYTVPAGTLHEGDNVFAVEVHQCNTASTDLYWSLGLTLDASSYVTDSTAYTTMPITADTHILARAYSNGEWSPLTEVTLEVAKKPVDYSGLRVTEMMYAPPDPTNTVYQNDDLAWLEFRNIGTNTLDLAGVNFTSGIEYTFTSLLLAPGARMVLAKTPAAFAEYYDTNNITLLPWTSGNLSRKGETISIADPSGTNILTYTYAKTWYPTTFNTGCSLVVVDPKAEEPLWSTAANWRPSGVLWGTPGSVEQPAFTNIVLDTAAGRVTVRVGGLEDPPELWVCDDLVLGNWELCPDSVWTRNGDLLTIDLLNAELPGKDTVTKRFFQIRVKE